MIILDGDDFDMGRPNDERGFIHKKILGIGGSILSTVGNIAPFLPASGILRTAGSIATRLSGGGGPPPGPLTRQPFSRPVSRQRPAIIGPGAVLPGAIGPGGILGAAGAVGGITGAGAPHENGVCPPRGFHLNKSSYFLRDGTFVPERSRMVRNRRLNNANGRAQDKAIVRLEKGQDHAKKLLRATGWRTIS